GDQDLVVSRGGSSPVVAWYANDGSGNLTHQANLSTSYKSEYLTTGDLNGDGTIDVLVAAGSHDTVAWYANNGSGSFTEQTPLSTNSGNARWVLAADLDEDGDLDVAAASGTDSKIAWFRNENLNGGFSSEIVLSTSHTAAMGIGAGDLDGDGVLDLVTDAIMGDKVYWHPGIATAGWDNLVSPVVSPDGETVFVGDNTNHDLWILGRDSSSGELTAKTVLTDGENGVDGLAGVSGLAISPDGKHIYTAGQADNAIGVFQTVETAFPSRNEITSLAVGALSVFGKDVDGDGGVDVLSASWDDDAIRWYENDGSQAFTPHLISSSEDGARMVAAADVDGDGDMDVISASWLDDTIAWHENNGSQTFVKRVISSGAIGAADVVAIDLDAEGDLDVLSASTNDNTIAWYENDGSQTFVKNSIATNVAHANSVFAVDIDGDGDLDVLAASETSDTVLWFENAYDSVPMNFSSGHVISAGVDGVNTVFAIDVDGDGDIDVLTASHLDDTVAWYENDGDQAFTAHTISSTADHVRDVFAVDVDGDGDVDVVTASSGNDTTAWYENDGSQGFTEHVIHFGDVNDAVHDVFPVDLDGDGDLDVLTASNADDTIAWYRNTSSLEYTEVIRDGENDVDGLAGVQEVVVSNDGNHVYAAGRDDNALAVFSRNTTTGSLSFVEVHTDGADGVEGLEGASAVAISPDGTYVYATGATDQQVATFLRDAATGELSFVSSIGDESGSWLDSVNDVTVGPSNGHVYTASRDGDAVGVFEPINEFHSHLPINSSADTARNVFATDLDGDGDTDVLSAAYVDDEITWYENVGSDSPFS
ncbi:MAG: FG-GAP-like repeat-containing protein, partial [Pirellulaceae bacterium]